MEIKEPERRISKRALTVWKIASILHSLIIWVLGLVGIILVNKFEWSKWLIVLILFIAILYSILFILIIPNLRWKRWRYEVREQEIELQHGVFIIKRTLVPMVRVQHVDTIQGPLLRKYHLSTVTISTAATVHHIPAIDIIEADRLRHSISALARMDEDDV